MVPPSAGSSVRLDWACVNGTDGLGSLTVSMRRPTFHTVTVSSMLPTGLRSTWRRAPTPLVFPPTARVARRPLQWLARWGKSANRAQRESVGARRHVDLKPVGSMEETVTVWKVGRRIDTVNEPSPSVPFTHAQSSLTLEPADGGTMATFDYRYVPRGGPLGVLTGPVIDRMLTRSFTDMLTATDHAAARDGEH